MDLESGWDLIWKGRRLSWKISYRSSTVKKQLKWSTNWRRGGKIEAVGALKGGKFWFRHEKKERRQLMFWGTFLSDWKCPEKPWFWFTKPFNIEEQFFKPRNSHGLGKNDKEMIRKEKREVDGESSFHWKVKKKIPWPWCVNPYSSIVDRREKNKSNLYRIQKITALNNYFWKKKHFLPWIASKSERGREDKQQQHEQKGSMSAKRSWRRKTYRD